MKTVKFIRQEEQGENFTPNDYDNYLGFDEIEIIAFNYDGKGNALSMVDGDTSDLNHLSSEDVDFLIYAGWYKTLIS